MSVKVASNLFMFSPLAVKHAGLYQQLLTGVSGFQDIGNKLVRVAGQAQAFRQYDVVKEAALILINLPLSDFQAIGYYYLALIGYRNRVDAKEAFEHVAEHAPLKYRALAMHSLAAIEAKKQDHTSELRWLNESLKIAPTVQALRGIAVVKAKEGFHKQALNDLENLYPFMQYSEPLVYFDYLNSLAVELGEAGRKDEARDVARVVLASPFAHAYPEWQETTNELREANHSFAAVPQIRVEQREIKHPASEPLQPAAVLSFPKLKEAPPPEKPEQVTPIELKEMTADEKREMIIAALRSGTIEPNDYDKIIFMFGLLKSGPTGNILNLEDETVLEDLIIIWAAHVGSEQLAAVMSALRDCEDDIRRANLIDRIIRKAFEESMTCDLTEEQWRLKVECRLPEK